MVLLADSLFWSFCFFPTPNHTQSSPHRNHSPITQIPKEQEPRIRASPRACAVAYPTRVVHGLLFVFTSPDAAAAAAAPLPLIPELEAHSLASGAAAAPAGWGFRDLPYGCGTSSISCAIECPYESPYESRANARDCRWEAFMENVTDSAHVPVAHHNITGNRRATNEAPAAPSTFCRPIINH